mgnify:CR=1 FL=1
MRVARWLAILIFAGPVFALAASSQDDQLVEPLELSKILQSQGKIKEARSLSETALSIGKVVYGGEEIRRLKGG